MSLDPDLARAIAHLEASDAIPHGGDLAERRPRYERLSTVSWPTPEEVATVADLTLATEPPLRCRHYTPPAADPSTILLFFHGGSFVLGSLSSHDALCRSLARATGLAVAAVEYRRAPECPFPAAVEDACSATRFVARSPSLFGAGVEQVVVVGDSAGAALAAAAVTATKDDGLPVVAQILAYPTVGPSIVTKSAHEFAHHPLLDVDQLRRDYALYVNGADTTDPRISLLTSPDLTGSPPAIVLVAEIDPLRDEGVAYAGLLQHFGVPVRLLEAEGMVHGFLRLGSVPSARSVYGHLASELGAVLGARA